VDGAGADAQDRTQNWYDEQFYAIVTDLVGTPTELLDDDGRLTARRRTTLWGADLSGADPGAETGTEICPLRFPGQYWDPETQLAYNHFRHYDPETARYASPDPLGLAAAPNPRSYVSNPLHWADPLGLAPGTYRGAPGFIGDARRTVQDVRAMGRPDGELVLSGHGGIRAGDGTAVTVPEGTSVAMYSEHGVPISDRLGNMIETGNPTPLEVYGPGELLPDYTSYPPSNLNIMGTPRNVTVTSPTQLSDLLRPNMGRVHWAACRSVIV
jgi:RHS repeat-associated protein